jgi:hypothetical protein
MGVFGAQAGYQRLEGQKILMSARVSVPGNPTAQGSANETTPAGTVAFAFPRGETVTGQVLVNLNHCLIACSVICSDTRCSLTLCYGTS